jgi:hypothetical protein
VSQLSQAREVYRCAVRSMRTMRRVSRRDNMDDAAWRARMGVHANSFRAEAIKARREYYALLDSLSAYTVARWRWKQARRRMRDARSVRAMRERARDVEYRRRVALVERAWEFNTYGEGAGL